MAGNGVEKERDVLGDHVTLFETLTQGVFGF